MCCSKVTHTDCCKVFSVRIDFWAEKSNLSKLLQGEVFFILFKINKLTQPGRNKRGNNSGRNNSGQQQRRNNNMLLFLVLFLNFYLSHIQRKTQFP